MAFSNGQKLGGITAAVAVAAVLAAVALAPATWRSAMGLGTAAVEDITGSNRTNRGAAP